MHDAIIISDLHLGSEVCQAGAIRALLEQIRTGTLQTAKLILNGDVFDSWNFSRLRKQHWKILGLLRKISAQTSVIWLEGNHDYPAENTSHLIGAQVLQQYTLESGDRKILVLHGHQFDKFMSDHPWLSWIGDTIYWSLQKLDKSLSLAHNAKRASKAYLRNSELVMKRAIEFATRSGHQAVCCGHTHHPIITAAYYNSGCWTDKICTYITITQGQAELHTGPTPATPDSAQPN